MLFNRHEDVYAGKLLRQYKISDCFSKSAWTVQLNVMRCIRHQSTETVLNRTSNLCRHQTFRGSETRPRSPDAQVELRCVVAPPQVPAEPDRSTCHSRTGPGPPITRRNLALLPRTAAALDAPIGQFAHRGLDDLFYFRRPERGHSPAHGLNKSCARSNISLEASHG